MPFDLIHYRPKKIAKISKTDSHIALIGKVIETKENSFTLSDDTGKLEIETDQLVKKGKLIRVFCSIIDEKPQADIIQDLTGLDLNLYKKVEELYNKAGVNV